MSIDSDTSLINDNDSDWSHLERDDDDDKHSEFSEYDLLDDPRDGVISEDDTLPWEPSQPGELGNPESLAHQSSEPESLGSDFEMVDDFVNVPKI